MATPFWCDKRVKMQQHLESNLCLFTFSSTNGISHAFDFSYDVFCGE